MNTTYKGFNIEFRSNGVTIDSGRYYVMAEGFKDDGYSTLNNAKGAITKHQQQQEAQRAGMAGQPVAKAASSDDTDRASVELPAPPAEVLVDMASLPPVGWTTKRNLKGDPIHGNPRTAHVYAQMDYYGMDKERDTRSRRKREGKPGPRRLNQWIAKGMNRKQRKLDKLISKGTLRDIVRSTAKEGV